MVRRAVFLRLVVECDDEAAFDDFSVALERALDAGVQDEILGYGVSDDACKIVSATCTGHEDTPSSE